MKNALSSIALAAIAVTGVLAAATPAAAAPVRPATVYCGNATWFYGDSSVGVQCNGPVTTQYRAWVTCTGHGSTKYYGTWYAEVPNGNTPTTSTAYCPGSNSFVVSHGVSFK